MKVLVFGAGGMIGHKMFQAFSAQKLETYAVIRQKISNYAAFNLFNSKNTFDQIDILEAEKLEKVLTQVKPDVILNCIGVTLRKPEITNLEYCRKVNTDFPWLLNNWVSANNSYLIHFSTDCVFSGKESPYSEASPKTATDNYGITKAAGEVTGNHSLTLRGSMIGRELFGKTELLEWAISKKNQQIKGFSKAIYSGVTTNVMAELVHQLLHRTDRLTGLYQVSSAPISKFDLLKMINSQLQLNMTIVEDSSYATSKVLISDKLAERIGFYCPSWPVMIENLSKDSFQY